MKIPPVLFLLFALAGYGAEPLVTITPTNNYSTTLVGNAVELHRPNVTTASGVRFYRDDEALLAGGAPHWCEWGMDYAVGGYYHAFYDSGLDKDVFQIGVDGPYAGRFAMGQDAIDPNNQLSIHDLPGITYSLAFWSQTNSILCDSIAVNSDSLTLRRSGTSLRRWIHFAQGDTTRDLRLGWVSNAYELGLFAGDGISPTSPANPGDQLMRINHAGVWVSVPFHSSEISNLQERVSELEAMVAKLRAIVMKQNSNAQ